MDSDEDYQSQDLSFETLAATADTLDCTPIKSVSKRDKVSYGKRKVKQIHTAVKLKCAHMLDISQSDLESSQDDKSCQGCKDLNRFVLLLKDKIHVSSRHEKIKLLTLTPESWSQEKTATEFNVTKHMVKKARQLKKEKAILANPDPKSGKPLSEEIVHRIVEHYQNDQFTRMCPGKKDRVPVKTAEGKVYKQKRLILMNLKELYVEYSKRFPDDQVGFSKFCELRPKWCVPVTAAGMHSVCVCQIHQNVKLLAAAVPGVTQDYKDILSKMVCDVENRNCMLHLCEMCPGKDAIEAFCTDLFITSEFDLDDIISYKQWGHTDRSELVSLTNTVQKFIEKTCTAFDNLREHRFIAKSQAKYLTELKENLPPNQALILLDFAENYSFLCQAAVQGFHWNNAQATLHPFVIYFRERVGSELKCTNICVISDCLKLDTLTIHAFITIMMSHVKSLFNDLSLVIYFSDGAAAQYKNCKNFANLCSHIKDYGIPAEWHFFATSHLKSPCNGISGTVKRLVAHASLQATTTGQILTPKDMYEWSCSHIPGIKFLYISTEDVAKNAERFSLLVRFGEAKTLTGTRSHHCFIPKSDSDLKMKRISADLDHTNVCSNPSVMPDSVTPDQLQPGKYAVCLYDQEWHVGCVLEFSDEHQDIQVDFMKRVRTGLLNWPAESRRDRCWVPLQHVLCVINAPELQGQSARFYKLSASFD